MYFVGIDIAKHHHEAAILDESGKVIIKKLKFNNSNQGYNKLMNQVRKLNSEEVVFAMEATGHYWLPLYAHLRSDNQTIHVINPIQSDAMYIRKTKNDAVDSQIIADVVRFGRYCQTQVAPVDLLSLRELCRRRFYIKARNSFGIVMASSSFALIIRQLIEQIKSLEYSIAAFDKEIERLFANFDTQLTTITGIGTTVAAFKDPAINQFYEKKKAEGKEYLTIIGHICRKMVSIIFAVLRDNKPYVPILKSV